MFAKVSYLAFRILMALVTLLLVGGASFTLDGSKGGGG